MEFELTRVSASAFVVPLLVVVFCLTIAGLFGWIAWYSSRSAVSVQDGALVLRVPIYGRSIPVERIDLERAAIVSLDRSFPRRPTSRTNGLGIPGYSVGWFRLADGSKALLAVTSRDRVVELPTNEGFSVLVSPADPEGFLARLRAAAGQ